VRIVGGKWRRRNLDSSFKFNKQRKIRPTSDRVKENIFNVVENLRTGNPLKGAHVLDLFCGTGAMGLEALSRGADFCHFIDNSREAKRLTLKNVRKVGAEQNSMFSLTDILDLNQNDGVVSNLVFLDPPYGKNLGNLAISLLLENDWVNGDTIFILEKEVNGLFSSELTIVDQRVYGGTEILILKLENVLNPVDFGNSIQER
jgi:16S rRNA (guanine966-N2)-methyltransferase